MRNRFEQQLTLGKKLIEDTVVPTAKRNGALPALCAALKEMFVNPKWNQQIFQILDDAILPKNNDTGRPGMNLWQIFVLAQVRLCQNISYDDLHYLANSDKLVRGLMGVENEFPYALDNVDEVISYQRIKDNVGLLNDQTVKKLNEVIVDFGHDVFKKKDTEALRLKTDSFVVESNVHFPTDYNLLWDASRKSIDMICKLLENNEFGGWRKLADWKKELKNLMRSLGRASGSGGKGKEERLKKAAKKYLTKAKALLLKLEQSNEGFQPKSIKEVSIIVELKHFIQLMQKQIDLVERRILNGEKIPHTEKMFSIFEQYTEWIAKGKKRPNVELGKKAGITTDQFHLIVHYQVMENQADSEVVPKLTEELLEKHIVNSWSFDKGYWNPKNKEILAAKITTVVLPKKGKCNKQQAEEEQTKLFKKLRYKHSAVESNINELEHRGLNRCPDKGFDHFKRYVGLAVSAYNLRRIGVELLAQEIKRQKIEVVKMAA